MFTNRLKDFSSLEEIQKKVMEILDESNTKVGYVSGVITSMGLEHVDNNLRILESYTKKIRKENNFLIFSFTDLFDEKILININWLTISNDRWFCFFREMLKHSRFSDIFMIPGWEKSSGAKDEYKTAQKLGLKIHIVQE